MSTIVTLDADTELIVRNRMQAQRVSFNQALNDAIRDGAAGREVSEFRTLTFEMGAPTIDLDRTLQIGAELEDAALVARLRAESRH